MSPSPRLAIIVLASFLAGGLVPRAALVAHDHDGGDAHHVHLGPLEPHHHGAEGGHTHAHGTPGGAAVSLPHHVHVQHPFVYADRVVPPAPGGPVCVALAPTNPPRRPVDRAATAARSRGPPAPHIA